MSVQHSVLPNGFHVVSEHMPGLQSASVGVWVKTGGRNETLAQNGIAHFLEHMAFKGTKKRSALDIVELIENVGGYINAYTSREVTAYYTRVLKEDVALSIELLFDILQNSTLDAREVEIERGVILQEIGQSHDTPDDVVFDWLQETAFPNQALGRTILGPEERVKNFSRNDLISFVKTHYRPEQMILAAAGGLDHDEILKQAESTFGHLAKGHASVNNEVASFKGGDFRKNKDLEQAHVTMAFEGPNYLSKDIYTAQIYSIALGGGMSSRLFQEIRENRGLCYSIFSQASAYSDTGMLTLYAGTSGEQVRDLMELTVQELDRAARDMSQQELDRARAQMKAGLLMGLESASNRAERLARMIQIWGHVPKIEETIAKIEATHLSDVVSFAEYIAAEAPSATALYGPVKNAPYLDELKRAYVA